MRSLIFLVACSSAPTNTAGTVDLFSVAGPPTLAQALANFPDSFDNDTGCVASTVGACRVYDCSNEMTAGKVAKKNVGTISISDGATMIAKLQYQDGVYAPLALTPPLWKSGDLIEFDVGSQAIIKMSAPDPITLTSPAFPYAADFSKPLSVTWSGGTKGVSVVIHFAKYATCILPSETTSADIPAAALATIPMTGAEVYGYTARIVDLSGTTARTYTDLYGASGAELSGTLTPK
jgi:hypothetical protein